MKLIVKWLICVITFIAMSELFPELMTVDGGYVTLVVAGCILWLANILLRPILQLISLPITLITLGLFSLVVNAAMVGFTDLVLADMKIESFWVCILIALIISLTNSAVKKQYKKA